MTLKHFISLLSLLFLTLAVAAQTGNIEFVENKGQWDSRVKFRGDVSYGSLFIRQGGFTMVKHKEDELDRVYDALHGHTENGKHASFDQSLTVHSHAFNVDFVGASPAMQTIADKPAQGYNNYFIGDDPSKWAGGCKIYQALEFKEIYPNIDVRYYTNNGVLKYDIIVRPGGDISKLALKYDGIDKLEIKKGELVVKTSVGDFRESIPYSYQVSKEGRQEIQVKYEVKNNIVRFSAKGYNPSQTLVIDPTLIFCSFSKSNANNWGFTATYGPDGSFFGGGIVFGQGFPTITGAFQTNYGGGSGNEPVDIGIIKLSPDGSTLQYGTYIGGSGNEQPHSLVADVDGSLIIAGRTNSPKTGAGAYPVTGPILGSGSNPQTNDHDIIITKLNPAGTALVGSRRIGGDQEDGVNIRTNRGLGSSSLVRNYGDDGRSEVIVDGGGNIYVASCTQSGGFPATPGSFGNTLRGRQDAVILKFNANLSTNLFSGLLGGGGDDAAYVLSLDPAGTIYVAGGTTSTDFPGSQAGTVGTANSGGIDGFVAVIPNDGSSIIRSTYIGTAGEDQIYGIQFDRLGFPYILATGNGNWDPKITPGVGFANRGAKQFIAKLQPDLSAYVYCTVFGAPGGLPNISPTAFLVDRCENVYVSGWGGHIGISGFDNNISGTNGMPTLNAVTPPGRSGTVTDNQDFYFFVMQRNATAQLYGSFYGQFNGAITDHVDGGTSRFDRDGVIYQAVCASCSDNSRFPTTPGAFGTQKPAAASCNLGMIKIQFDLAGVGSEVSSSIGGVPRDTAGCLPLDVVFEDNVLTATEYIWNFGDNGTGPVDPSDPAYFTFNEGPFPASTGYTRPHTFNAVGIYRVMLIAIDPNSCNVRDTSWLNIRVGDLKANLDARIDKLAPCEAFNYQFNNLSTTDPSRPFTDTSFAWDFGDGSALVIAGMNPVTHAYAAPGTYDVKLIMRDTAYCNYPDTLPLQLRVSANVKAAFTTPPRGCSPYLAEFRNTSEGGATFQWDFGDPTSGANNTSDLINPTHLYNLPGTYTITLIANDPNTCNLTDRTTFTIVVDEKPDAEFTFAPTVPQVNTPTTFTNQSSANAIRFKWDFGDGDTLLTSTRTDVQHQYNATGTFNACLIAFTAAGCTDTVCHEVKTLVEPALDVPNAFTPNSGDVNSVVMPKGFGIAKLRFIIYNRWGQKVFETNSRNQGWNGRVKGVVQPMDVYAYTLEVEFFDGTRANKKGDITLIR